MDKLHDKAYRINEAILHNKRVANELAKMEHHLKRGGVDDSYTKLLLSDLKAYCEELAVHLADKK